MDWNELLRAYRELGGIAENVRLDEGALGRGIFPIDPALPAVLHTPRAITVPAREISIRDGRMTIESDRVGSRQREFFEGYQQYFGWGAGGYEESLEQQTAWHELAPEIASAIQAIGGIHFPQWRFLAPTTDVCMGNYLNARVFDFEGVPYVVPMIDLVNHSSYAAPYHVDGTGIGVRGTFAGEVLVRYNSADPWGIALNHGFRSPSPMAYSIGISADLHDGRNLAVERNISFTAFENQLALPTLRGQGSAMHLSFALLGFTPAMDIPRTVFRKVMYGSLDLIQADRLFDSIRHFNYTRFIELLRTLRRYDGALVRTLEEATIDQLDALSACIGARAP